MALSVFNSLCRSAARGHFPRLTDRDDLWRLLLTITKQKSVDQRRRESRKKRGGGDARGESVFYGAGEEGRQAGLDMLVGESPTPAFLAQLSEQCRPLLENLRDETLRRVALGRMEGYTIEELSEQLGISTRPVDRKLKLIHEKWARELER